MGEKGGVCSGYQKPGVSFKSNMDLNLPFFTWEALFWWIIKVIFDVGFFQLVIYVSRNVGLTNFDKENQIEELYGRKN